MQTLTTPAPRRPPLGDALFSLGDAAREAVASGAERRLADALARAARAFSGMPPFVCGLGGGCPRVLRSLAGFEAHVRAAHPLHACAACGAPFATDRLASLHANEAHGGALFKLLAARAPMYECLVEGCGARLRTPAERGAHMVADHAYPPGFVWGPPRRRARSQQRRPARARGGGGGRGGGGSSGGGGGCGGGTAVGDGAGDDDSMGVAVGVGVGGADAAASHAAPPPPGTRRRPPLRCRYVTAPGGCRAGAACRFSHAGAPGGGGGNGEAAGVGDDEAGDVAMLSGGGGGGGEGLASLMGRLSVRGVPDEVIFGGGGRGRGRGHGRGRLR